MTPEESEYRQKAKIKAIEMAGIIRPNGNYGNYTQTALGNASASNLISDAELIFQWLIKDTQP